MLDSVRREYDAQQRLTALAVHETERLSNRTSRTLAQMLRTMQAASIAVSLAATDRALAEQGIDTTADATVAPQSLLTDTTAATEMLDTAGTTSRQSQLVQTLVTDAARTAKAVAMVTRPAVTRYVRSLRPPSCARCAILAGRVYRYSQGFPRHPQCDCLMTPTDQTIGPTLVTDPKEAFDRGWIQTHDAKGNLRNDLSKADTEAVKLGANLGQVVNVQRREAGLRVGSSVMARKGILTPAGCLARSEGDRDKAIALLTKFGYIT